MISIDQIGKLRTKKLLLAFLDKHFGGDPEKFVFEISGSLNNLLITDLKQAHKYLKKTERTFKYLPESLSPRLLAMQARLAHWSGNPKSALKKYELSCKLFKKYGNKMAEMRTGVGLMDVHMYLGNYNQALKIGKASLKYFSGNNEPILAANTMVNLGNVYHRLDKNHLALKYYDKARNIYSGKDKPRLAMAEYNRANVYANLFKLDKAKELYQKASQIYRELRADINSCKSEYSLIYLEFLSDNYAVALKEFEIIYDKFIQLGDIKSASVTQLDLVELHLHLNQFGAALMVAQELITQFTKLGMNYEKGKSQYFAADASLKIGDLAKAAKMLTDAKRTFAKERNSLWLGIVSNARARLYLKKGKYKPAETEVSKALRYFVHSGDERRAMDASITLKETKLANKPTAAILESTRQLLQRPLASYQKFHLESLLGQHYLKSENFDKALKYCKSSIATLEKMLAGLYPDEVRYYFLEDKTAAFTSTVDCLLKMGKTSEGFSQNLQLMSIVNQRPAALKKIKQKVSVDLKQKIKLLRANLKSLNINAQLGQRNLESGTSFRRIEQQLWLSEQKLRSSIYAEPKAVSRKSNMVAVSTNLLPEDKTLLNYLSIGDKVGVFCSSRRRVSFFPLQISHKELQSIVRELDFIMENAIHKNNEQSNIDAANYYLNKLCRLLIEPVTKALDDRDLIFLVDGLFAQIPWNGIIKSSKDNGLKNTQIRIICNPLDLKNIGKVTGDFSKRKNAIFAVSSEQLPSVKTEADKIYGYFKGASLHKDSQATAETLKKELKTFDGFLHIAAHSSRSSENPLFSRILMGDGPFFPFDLFNSGVNTQLVTLSGCQTAAPGLYYGNSFSLAKSFMQAGSRFVLASLWPVRDEEVMKFMDHFYANLKVTENVFESYNFAVTQTQTETENPAVWSSFVLMGL